MGDVARIARCPEHGLHGARTECYECGGPVERVLMVELAEGESVFDRDKVTEVVRSRHRLWKALEGIRMLEEAVDLVNEALDVEPDFDAIPAALTLDELLDPELHAEAAVLVPAHPVEPVHTVGLVAQALAQAARDRRAKG